MGLSVTLDGIQKSFGNETIVSNLSTHIEAGEFVALMGPSGCGKSTLLNLLAGLDTPDSGTLILGDQCLNTLSNAKRDEFRLQNVSFVFQFFHLLPTLTVLENVCLPSLAKKLKPTEYILNLAVRTLAELGLAEASDKYPSQLSGGMLARAGLARALVSEPKLLLADEPTGSLDSKTGHEILKILQREQSRLGFTLIMVTHDLSAAQLSQRVLKMQDGRLIS